MDNDNITKLNQLRNIDRLWKLQTQVNKLIMEGKRNPEEVSKVLQNVLVQKAPRLEVSLELGTIALPENYEQKTHITNFRKRFGKKFNYWNPEISDKNFWQFCEYQQKINPSDRFDVKLWKLVEGDSVPAWDIFVMLQKLTPRPAWLGVYGGMLVYEYKRDLLPSEEAYYPSFDDFSRFRRYRDKDGYYRLPTVPSKDFRLAMCGIPFGNGYSFLSFSKQ